jgi:hypothetical protein
MITTLVMRAYPDIDGDQIIVDLNAGSPSEDEEYDPEKADIDNDGETEDWEEGLAKKRGFVSQGEEDEEGGVQTLKHLLKGLGFKAAKPGLNTYYSDADKIIELYGIPMRAGHYADIFVAITDNPNEPYTLVDAEGSTEFTNANDIVKELQKRSGSTEDEEYGCGCEDEECNCEEESMVSEARGYNSLTPAELIAELQSVIDLPNDKLNDVTRISMRVSREEIHKRYPEIYKMLEKMYDAVMKPNGAKETKNIAQKAIEIVRSKYPNPDKYQRMRPISSYNNTMVSESYTSVYLTEMTRKSYGKAPAPQTVTFKERMKPKTIWQLNELRNYGL